MNKTLKLILSFLLVSSLTFSIPAQAFFDERAQAPSTSPSQRDQPQVQPSDSDEQTAKYAPDHIIVKFKEGKSPERDVASLNTKHKVKQIKKLFTHHQDAQALDNKFKERAKRKPKNAVVPKLDQIYILEVDKGKDILSMVNEYKNNPNVEYAEPDYEAKVQMVPNDPYYASSNSWGQGYDDMWGLKKIQASQAWDITQGSGVVVAVIDTGVDYNHPDLATNIWTNTAEIPNNNIDDDNNGYVDDDKGWDFVGVDVNNPIPDKDPMDGHGHGTHCSGTIAAKGNNNLGVIGVAPQARIMAIKGLDDTGSGYDSDLAAAVIYAADNGADILSNSWGGLGSSQAFTDAFHYAHSQGVVAIAAAGNNNIDVSFFTPANIDTVIAVASTDQGDVKSDFSNHGLKIDVAAPGGGSGSMYDTPTGQHYYVNILSLRASGTDMYLGAPNYTPGEFVIGNNYYRSRGTSMACPHVAGAAALILARNSLLTNEEVRGVLKITSNSVSNNPYIGQGRINTYNAVVGASSPVAGFLETNGLIGGKIDIEGTAKGTGFISYSIYLGAGTNPQSWNLLHTSSIPVDNNILYPAFETRAITDGTYMLKLEINYSGGKKLYSYSRIEIKNFPLSFPMNNDIFKPGGIIEIRGNIWSDVSSFSIQIGSGFNPASWSAANITMTGNRTGVLANWNTASITQNGFYNIKLNVQFLSGQSASYYVYMIYFETKLKTGWPQYIPMKQSSIGFIPEGAQDVRVADLDNDGYKEIITISTGTPDGEKATLMVFRRDGTLWWSKDTGSSLSYGWLAIGDIDNDGFMEIVTNGIDYNSFFYSIVAYNHDGSIVSGWPIDNLVAEEHSFVIADLNKNGTNEIITQPYPDYYDFSTQSLQSKLYIFNGDGSVRLDKTLPRLGDANFGSRVMRQSIAVGNFDDDPNLEIVARSGPAGLTVLNEDGTELPGWPVQTQGVFIEGAPVAGDLNGDGYDEVIITSTKYSYGGDTGLYVYQKDGSLMPGWPVLVSSGGFESESAALADLDEDGDLEIMIPSRRNEYQYAYHHTGQPVTGWPKLINSNSFMQNQLTSNAIADINGDGKLDVLLVAGGIDPYVLGTGSVSFSGGLWAWSRYGVPIDLNSDPNSNALFMELGTYRLNTNIWLQNKAPAVVTDLENDGLLEVVATSRHDSAYNPSEALFDPAVNDIPKGRSSIYVWQLGTAYNSSKVPWPTFQHDNQQTGRYPFSGSIIPPQAPTSLTATAASSSQINLSWTDNSANETGFKIERSTNSNGPFNQIGTTGTNVNIYTDLGLTAGTPYYYRTRATNAGGDSAYSNIANVTTQTATPSAPSSLTAQAASSSQINLSWMDNSSNETGFKIERSTASKGPFTQIATTAADATSYSNTGLTAGTTYYYRVRAYNAAGDSAYSNAANATTQTAGTIPTAPSGLTATAVSSSQINLSWTDTSNNETGFKIERSPDSVGPFIQIGMTSGGVNTYSDTGLTASTIYYYRVRATNAAGDSAYSNTANATTQTAGTIPTAPSGLTATAVSSSQINLSWTDNSSNETGFKIERSTDNVTFAEITTTASNVATFNNTGLTAGTTYYYRVRATSTAGDSAYSNVANATTQAAGTIPTAPTALSATAVSSTQINLSWLDNSDNETGFKIERSTSNKGPFTEIATTAANVATYNNTTGLTAGTTYYYRVRAYNIAGNSAYSSVANATTQTTATLPSAPTNLTAQAVSSSQINLSWTDTSSNETGFKIERSTNNKGPFTQIATTASNASNVMSYDNTGLAAGTTYYYRIRAYNSAGNSAYSNVASARTQ